MWVLGTKPRSSVRAATVLSSEPSLQACHLPPHPQVLSRALMYIPQLGKYAESILENGSSSGRKLAKLQRIARQAVAALCALGGFKETIKIGSEVQVTHRCFPWKLLLSSPKHSPQLTSASTVVYPEGQQALFLQTQE